MTASQALVKNQKEPKKSSSGRGGYRPGGGRPKGSISDERRAQLRAEATLKELATQHTETAIKTLVTLLKSAKTPAAARVAAIKEILDRGHGKATQTIAGDPDNPLHVAISRIELVAPGT